MKKTGRYFWEFPEPAVRMLLEQQDQHSSQFPANPPFRPGSVRPRLFNTRFQPNAQVAQSVEQRTDVPR